MKENISSKKMAKNVLISVLAQIISLIISFAINFFVPKFIDLNNYSYWQTFVLYSGYVGVLHFGLLDGFILRYSKYDYEELDKPLIRSQFQILLIFNSFLTIIGTLIASLFFEGITSTIIILVSVSVITKNALTYSSYSFQITNRINKYASVIIFQRLAYGALIALSLILRINSFYVLCLSEIVSEILAFSLSAFFNKGVYFGKFAPIKRVLKELKINLSAGVMLMLANWSAILIINGAKTVIQIAFDELVFGKVAFAFTISNVFLTFITAISVVLFPSLKRLDQEKLPSLYISIRNVLAPVLIVCLLLYFPGAMLIRVWLPNYAESLIYLGVFMPTIIYSSKVNLLTNTYLKAYRKEKTMLLINLLIALLGLGLFIIFAYLYVDLTLILISMVFVIVLYSVISEIVVLKTIKQKLVLDFIYELLVTASFILSVLLLDFYVAFIAFGAVVIIYLVLNYKKIAQIFNTSKKGN